MTFQNTGWNAYLELRSFLHSFIHFYHLDIFEPCSLAGYVSHIKTQNMTSLTTSLLYSSVVRAFQPIFWKVMGSTPVGELRKSFSEYLT